MFVTRRNKVEEEKKDFLCPKIIEELSSLEFVLNNKLKHLIEICSDQIISAKTIQMLSKKIIKKVKEIKELTHKKEK